MGRYKAAKDGAEVIWDAVAGVYRRVSDGLDMSHKARMGRADRHFPTEAYSGSTHDIRAFDGSLSSPEGDWGRGTYASTSIDDVNANYAGEGPDLTGRIAMESERVADDLMDDEILRDEMLADIGWTEAQYLSDEAGAAEAIARHRLKGPHDGAVYPLRLNTEKYAVIGGPDSTKLYADTPDLDGLDPDSDEYYEAIDEAYGGLYQRVSDALADTGMWNEDQAKVMEALTDRMADGVLDLDDLDDAIRSNVFEHYTIDDELGSPGQASAEVLEALGFEGVIDNKVDLKFGAGRKWGQSMSGVYPDTQHIVTFPGKERNIRSTSAAFDPAKRDSPNLLAGGAAAAVGLGASEESEAGPIKIVDEATGVARRAIEAWKGSPHRYASERLIRHADGREEFIVGDVDRLPDVPEGAEVLQDYPLGRERMDKIGTGEGAQAYGHGLYYADARGVGEDYRRQLTRHNIAVDGVSLDGRYARDSQKLMQAFPDMDDSDAEALAVLAQRTFTDPQQRGLAYQREAIEETLADYRPFLSDPQYAELMSDADFADTVKGEIADNEAMLRVLDKYEGRLTDATGSLYRVHLDVDPDTLLDWDKPLSEQSEAVQEALRPMLPEKPYQDAQGYWRTGAHGMYMDESSALNSGETWDAARGQSLYEFFGDNDPEVSARLREAGIPGIKYLDGNSRGAGEGSYNYVMFDDAPISIKERGAATPEAMAMAGAAGAFMQKRQESKGHWDSMRDDLMRTVEAANRTAGIALEAIDLPLKGYLGLSAVAGGLASGEGLQDALMRGGTVARQPVDQTAYNLGGAVTDATGSPALGTATNLGVLMGSPL